MAPASLPPIFDLVGNTPLLEVSFFAAKFPGLRVFLKCEWRNPGGSLKDRPIGRMLRTALFSGALKPGMMILDSSSGNAGIAYALFGAALGIPVEIVIPANASKERLQRLRAHGAVVRETDPMLGYDEAIRVAHQLAKSNPTQYFLADQYGNPENWRAHYEGTAAEILQQTSGRLTHFVCGVGTGGTLTGVSRRLKEADPKIQVVMLRPERFPGIEGLKPLGEPEDFTPPILDTKWVDREIPVTLDEAADWCERLAKEGVFCGQSTGANLVAAERLAKEGVTGTIVALACDTGERYFSTGLWNVSE